MVGYSFPSHRLFEPATSKNPSGDGYACNGRLRHALYHCARVAVIRDLPSKTYYTAQRQRGHSHGRALRAVADRLLRILVAMLTTGTLFDCSKARPPQVSNRSEKVA